MTIQLTDTGKRFNRDWVFRHCNYLFQSGCSYAITGPNGSGKSTLLQTIAGSIQPGEGVISYTDNETVILSDNVYLHTAIVAPYLEVIEEMTALEFLHFHIQFKPFIKTVSVQDIVRIIGLEKAAHQQIRFYSSGMKQRIKLAQAIFSDCPVLLLDEPCTNLDRSGCLLYHKLIQDFCTDKLIIVCSNDEQEYKFCDEQIDITVFK